MFEKKFHFFFKSNQNMRTYKIFDTIYEKIMYISQLNACFSAIILTQDFFLFIRKPRVMQI